MPQSLDRLPAKRIDPIAFGTLCIALVSVSFAPIFVRLSETDLGPNATITNRLFIFSVVFGSSYLIRQGILPQSEQKETPPLTLKSGLLLGSLGVVSIASLSLWAIALEYTSVAKCMLLNNLTPIFTSFGSWLFFRQQFNRVFLLGTVVALFGAIGLGLEDLNGAPTSLLGDCYSLLSAVFLGAYFLIVERLRSSFGATTIILCRGIIGSALLFPIVILTEGKVLPTTLVAWGGILGLGIVSEGFGQRLLANSMGKFSSSFVALFLLLEPILSGILACWIFGETITSTTWVGFAVVLWGIYLAQSSGCALQQSKESQKTTVDPGETITTPIWEGVRFR